MHDLDPRVDVETPEQIVFSYSVAGVGSRAAAAAIDYLIVFALFILLLILGGVAIGKMGGATERFGTNTFNAAGWAVAILILLQFVLMWGYYVLFEGLNDGQTPGKRIMKLRVVSDGGYSISFGASAVRNLFRMLDAQPFPLYGVGIVTALLNKSGKRIGDIVAGTFVIKESAALTRPHAETAQVANTRLLTTRLTDAEYGLLERYISRRQTLDPERRKHFTQQLIARFSSHLPSEPSRKSDAAMLLRLFEEERDARATGVAARSDTGAQREQHAIVALGAKRWNRFAEALANVKKRGLYRMSPEEVSTFVAQYRELTTDLARLQTAARGRSSDALFYVSRLVAGGHSVLYRQKRDSLSSVLRYITETIPRELRRSWLPIAISAFLFFVPSIVAYVVVVRTPSVAPHLLPEEMLHRARTGNERAQRGEGYVTIEEALRPVAASSIIANNIQVTYLAFISGLTVGIGTLFLLVMNGVMIGSAIGLFASYKVAHLILGFVAPHGVLELSAICIAGGGGLLIASAFLLPGERTRRQALVENGKRAITLIAGSTILLVIAGAIEGLISPRVWPLGWKALVSLVTAIGLLLYLSLGRSPRDEAKML